jgi:polyketide cyclase/dehydrase/lipid transport protein
MRWFWRLGWLFPRNLVEDAVATSVHITASPETAWQRILLYEDVPARPPFLLRALLPRPLSSEGEKGHMGATVCCRYDNGGLVKRIKAVEAPHHMRFDVVEQRLGIEGSVTAVGGCYEIRPDGDGCEIVLTTIYLGHLRPRLLWRPLERFLARRLHRHILDGMCAGIPCAESAAESTIEARPASAAAGGPNSTP